MRPGDDKKMNRSMGTNILKDNHGLILVQELGWLFPFYDFTEDTLFFHGIGDRPAGPASIDYL
jgi:hypothetical protein